MLPPYRNGGTKQLRLLFFLLCIQYQASGQFVKSFLIDEKGYGADSANAKYTRTVFWNQFKQLSFEDHSLVDNQMYQSGGIVADTLVPGSVNGDYIRFYRNSTCTRFYANGKKKLEGLYQKGRPLGIFKAWYENGRKKGAYQYDEYQGQKPPYDHDFRIISFFDRDGRQLTKEGTGRYIEETEDSQGEGRVVFGMKNGFWQGTYEIEGTTYAYEEFYRNGRLERGLSKTEDGSSRKYKDLKTIPKYKDGVQTFYSFVSRHLRYPKSARKAGIQGEVYVMFTVDESGHTTQIEIAKSLQEDCDAQAIAAIDRADHFTPAFYRGRKVKSRMIMPISFSSSGL